ncbi:MAG: hypothetical protein HY981_01280 [Candidatus Magasanikbacteria bacterium]|nr:hypothetical protein [Candidatus Magasanikbacteria bacterium]
MDITFRNRIKNSLIRMMREVLEQKNKRAVLNIQRADFFVKHKRVAVVMDYECGF